MYNSPPEYLRNIVRQNTGNRQPEQMEKVRLKLIAVAHGELSLEEFEAALKQAVEDGLLVESDAGYSLPNDTS